MKDFSYFDRYQAPGHLEQPTNQKRGKPSEACFNEG